MSNTANKQGELVFFDKDQSLKPGEIKILAWVSPNQIPYRHLTSFLLAHQPQEDWMEPSYFLAMSMGALVLKTEEVERKMAPAQSVIFEADEYGNPFVFEKEWAGLVEDSDDPLEIAVAGGDEQTILECLYDMQETIKEQIDQETTLTLSNLGAFRDVVKTLPEDFLLNVRSDIDAGVGDE